MLLQCEEDHAGGGAGTVRLDCVALGAQDGVERTGHVAGLHEERLDDEAVSAPQQGLVQHLDHGQRPGQGVHVAPEQQRVAFRVLQDIVRS